MPKMENVLREEIGRLARKEIRDVAKGLEKEIRELRTTVRELKREIAQTRAKAPSPRPASPAPALAAAAAAARSPKSEKSAPRTGTRLSAGLIKKLRKRLGISQDSLAALLQVSKATVASWEQDRAKPRPSAREAIIALRDLSPAQIRSALESSPTEGAAAQTSPDDGE